MRRAMIVPSLAAVLLLLAAACNGEEPAVQDAPPPDQPPAGDILTSQVDMTDNQFGVETLRAPAGEEFQVLLVNNGDNPHTFTVEALGVDSGAIEPGGGSSEVTFTFPDEPTEFICSFHPGQMQGTLEPE